MFKHRINFLFYDEVIWKQSSLYLLSILKNHLIKIEIYISELGRSRAHEYGFIVFDST